MSKPPIKFPQDLSILERVDLNSVGEDRNKIFPIMSISKSFCGAVCALMAVDGKFGVNGVNATLKEVLDIAKITNPQKAAQYEKIGALQDLKLTELLTHRSGIVDNCDVVDGAYKGRDVADYFAESLKLEARGKRSYCNENYTLIEEMINLVSEKGSYEAELRARIFAESKLNLTHTQPLQQSAEALGRVGAVTIFGGTPNHNGKICAETLRCSGDFLNPFGQNSIAAGGLSSSVENLQKFAFELSKMILGQANLFENDLQKTAAISKSYRQILSVDNHDSLGVVIAPLEADPAQIRISHEGGFLANKGNMLVTAPYSFDEVKNPANFFVKEPVVSEIFLRKHDGIAKRYIIERGERLLKANMPGDISAQDLIAAKQAFKSAQNEVEKYEQQHLNEEGVIDSAKIAAVFFNKEAVEEKIDKFFATALEQLNPENSAAAGRKSSQAVRLVDMDASKGASAARQ